MRVVRDEFYFVITHKGWDYVVYGVRRVVPESWRAIIQVG